jgi:hypothetical protein
VFDSSSGRIWHLELPFRGEQNFNQEFGIIPWWLSCRLFTSSVLEYHLGKATSFFIVQDFSLVFYSSSGRIRSWNSIRESNISAESSGALLFG